tara:strand:+ start:412 stop:699 length:288 start_codon:yes stop_codon:yes gene_type:complete
MKKQPPFYKTGISAPHPTTGTTSFPTTKSRESKYTLKDLAGYAGEVAMSILPIGRIFKAGKAASYLSKLNKKFPSGAKMKEHYDSVNKGIKQIKK